MSQCSLYVVRLESGSLILDRQTLGKRPASRSLGYFQIWSEWDLVSSEFKSNGQHIATFSWADDSRKHANAWGGLRTQVYIEKDPT